MRFGPSNYTDRDYSRYGPIYKRKLNLSDIFNSQVNPDELAYLEDLASKIGGPIANLGCYIGHSTVALAKGLKDNSKVYSIDLFLKKSQIKRLGIEAPCADQTQAEKFINEHKVTDKVKLCCGSTDEWFYKLKDIKFSLVFIDADHKYEAVKQDFKLWGSISNHISFHDIHLDSVHKVIEELPSCWEIRSCFHGIKTFRRK